jgi:hypothetical protein
MAQQQPKTAQEFKDQCTIEFGDDKAIEDFIKGGMRMDSLNANIPCIICVKTPIGSRCIVPPRDSCD